jgi:iron complex outermembrane recepter protein
MGDRRALWLGLLMTLSSVVVAQQAPPPAFVQNVSLNIPSQPIASAIRELGQQSGLTIVIESQLGRNVKSPALVGSYTIAEALQRILPKALHTEYLDQKTVAVMASQPTAANLPALVRMASVPGAADVPASSTDGPSNSEQPVSGGDSTSTNSGDDAYKNGVETVVVTGTHIRGVPADSAQIIVYDRAAINQSGAVTLEDFSRQIPENFASVGTLGVFSGSINGTGRNESGDNNNQGAGFNLHGLGSAETLTLINGHRIAAAGLSGQFVDISLIPLSAIERIEILPDGASAIYGADAVAGVVNIILRSDYDGAETSVRAGGATEGGDHEGTVSQVIGTTWSGGSALVAYEYNRQNGLRADQRDFIPVNYGDGLGESQLYPEQTRNSVMLTGRQDVGSATNLSGDAMFSVRHYTQDTASPLLAQINDTTGTPKEFGATLSLNHGFAHGWHLELSPSFYRTDQPVLLNQSTGTDVSNVSGNTRIDLAQVHLHVDGSVASLPGGSVKAAVGTEFRRDTLASSQQVAFDGLSQPFESESSDLARTVASGFAEMLVPIVGQDNARVGLRRFDVSLAGRYDHYSSGGAAATPRITLLFSPVSDLVLHSSYASAFVAPRLDQLAVTSPQYEAVNLSDPTSATGTTDTLFRTGGNGGNAELKPERSKTFTLGMEQKLSPIPGLSLSGTYFNTTFRNQILQPTIVNFNDILHDPTLAPFVNLAPNPATIAQLFNSGQVVDFTGPPALGATGVQATFDDRFANLAVSRQSGVDVSTNYSRDVAIGTVGLSMSGTYLIKYDTQNASSVPATVLLNRLGEPVNLRANAILSWSVVGFSSALNIHYVNHYENPLFAPSESISSWTTADLHVAYALAGMDSPILRGLGVALDVRNLLDRAPPSINLPMNFNPFNPGFDGANADPLGRAITFQLRKQW